MIKHFNKGALPPDPSLEITPREMNTIQKASVIEGDRASLTYWKMYLKEIEHGVRKNVKSI